MEPICDLGMVGLGVMGRNLVLNMAEHGFAIAGYDRDLEKVKQLGYEARGLKVTPAENLEDFISALISPRVVMMLVPAGAPVDAVIHELLPYLHPGDLIIDGGNSFFKDTDLRAQTLESKGIRYLGVGISGGESGARHGPSLMPGGPKDAYERVRPIFEAVAAKVGDQPCVAYLGPGSAGHYVKMVHNGIEYGLMEIIAETYDLMKRGMGLTDEDLETIYTQWAAGDTNSYLLEITARIFAEVDQKTGRKLINVILDEAKQKGTGKWTSQSAMDLQIPVPTIDAAVAMRDLSAFKEVRGAVSKIYENKIGRVREGRDTFLPRLRNAYYSAALITYAQGMALLRTASQTYAYHLDLEEIARIWRGGCIIRAAVLEDLRAAYRTNSDLANLLLDPELSARLKERVKDLRLVVQEAAFTGVPAPALAASLAYFDGYRSAWLPANLIQAQRDYFGAHTYERTDEKGIFHTVWEKG